MSGTGKNTTDDQKDAKGKREKRRTLLAAIAATGALASEGFPKKWSRPVIDSVVLPAHAQQSPFQTVTCTVSETISGFRMEVFGTSTGTTVTLPFTGSEGEIPPSTQTPSASSALVRWFYTITANTGGGVFTTDGNTCRTVSRGVSSYTIPLIVDTICLE